MILDPGGDALLPSGLTLAELRPELARLTGDDVWRTAALSLDGRPLADDHVTGVPPWLAGSVLSPAAGRPADDGGPVPAPRTGGVRRLVVVDGPRAGTTLDDPARVVLGRRGPRGRRGARGRRRGEALDLADPLVSRAHAVVRRGRHGWTVRDLGSANGSTLLHGTARRRPGRVRLLPPHVPRRARPGDALRLGSTVVLLDGPPPPPSRTVAVLRAVRHPTVLLVLAAGLVISAVTGSTTFLVLALLAPLSALAARLGTTTGDDGLAERRRDEPGGPDGLGADDRSADDDPVAHLPVAGGLPLLVDARDTRRATVDREGAPAWWPLAQDGLAVRGSWAVGAARALALAATADPGRCLTALLGGPAWDWLRWADGPLAGAGGLRVARTPDEATTVLADVPDGPLLVLDVLGSAWRPQVHRWFARRREHDAVVVVLEPGAEPPPWCRWTLDVGPAGAVLTGDGARRDVIAPPVTAATAEAVARARAPGWTGGTADLPARVGWGDLGLPTTAREVLAAWSGDRAADRAGPTARLGLGAHGRPVDVDLRRDGPHALVAGTTGAGKSELLQTLLLSLATTHAPHELAFVLVDHKGGAGVGACAGLPHVVGTVTDLDPAGSARALAALRTELRRREHLVAAAGVTDLDGLRRTTADAPPRLLVVVDEFRALVEDLPDFVPGLVRVATQGRSLGVHLVLATQRPAGVVDAQLRANLPLRVCLRVADRADSLDVVDVPDAASIPAHLPGRALVQRPGGGTEPVQTAWAALATASADGVRWAPSWCSVGPSWAADAVEHDPDAVVRLVDAAREAHATTGRPLPEAPWLPPLPATVRVEDLPDGQSDVDLPGTDSPGTAGQGGVGPATVAPGTIRLALGDRPDLRRRDVVGWAPDAGALLVAGGPASGRTTTLRTVTHAALRAGRHVHVVAQGDRDDWLGTSPGGGTLAGADDPGRVARLLDRLVSGVPLPTVLVVDDVGVVQQALTSLPRGVAEGLLDRVVREGRLRGLAVVLAGTPSDLVRHVPHAAARLVLPVADPHDARLLGVSTTPPAGPPGRGVVAVDGHDVVCQVALSAGPPPVVATTLASGAGPLVLQAIPATVRGLAPAALGLGGDLAGPVPVPTGPVLVVGPARSGRTTTLARIAAAHREAGRKVVEATDPLPDGTGTLPTMVPRSLAAGAGAVVVLDDVDLLLRTDPALDETVATWVGAGGPVVVASARTDRVAAAYRGALAALREGTVVVLDPAHPGSADACGADLSLHAAPAVGPGRGVVVHAGTLTPVQVALP